MNYKLSDALVNVTRTAMVLTPKQLFFGWLNNIYSDIKHDDLNEPDVYLLPDFETLEEMEAWLEEHFDWFFCEQMNNWNTDEALWVQNRTFNMFREWFHYSLHTMVWDTVEGPIKKLKY